MAKNVFSRLNFMESHIINAQQLAMTRVTVHRGVPHWWMILENMLEKEIIGAIVGQTVPLKYLVSERLVSFYHILYRIPYA